MERETKTSTAPVSVLLIDDDTCLGTMVSEFLLRANVHIDLAPSGEDGLRQLTANTYDIVLLDVMLPEMDGFAVLRSIRCTTNTPVIMLTACGEEPDRVRGFEDGADDYVAKPFSARELLGRIRAILRRHSLSGETLQVNDLTLNFSRNEAALQGGEVVPLTSVESHLLLMLLSQPGQLVAREHIYRIVFGREVSPFDRSLDTHISNLRRKLGQDGSMRILTVRGLGYRYAA